MADDIFPLSQNSLVSPLEAEEEERSFDDLMVFAEFLARPQKTIWMDGMKIEMVRDRVYVGGPGQEDLYEVKVRITDHNTDGHLALNRHRRDTYSKKTSDGALVTHSIPMSTIIAWEQKGHDLSNPDDLRKLLRTTDEGQAFKNKDTKKGMHLV